MENKMKYPYIGKANLDDSLVLFYSDWCGMCFRSDNWSGGLRVDYNERSFKNITHEYLANTYGEVQSPEHAEFIIDLAENAGFKVFNVGNEKRFFYFNSSEILFTKFKRFIPEVGNRKQITIPLPPKADKQESSEWPQVGDEVFICNAESDSRIFDFNNEKVKVIAKTVDDRGKVLTISHPSQGIGAIMLNSKYVKKPKTPDEEWLDNTMERAKSMGLSAKDVEKSLLSVFKKPQ